MRTGAISMICLALSGSDTSLKAPILRARIYPDQAWLTREVRVPLRTPGTHRFRVEALPPDLRLEDLRVQALGPEVRLGNVAILQEEGRRGSEAEVLALQAEEEALRPRIRDLQLRKSALDSVLKSLESLVPETAGNGSGRREPLDPLALAAFSRSAQAQHRALVERGLELSEELRPLLERLDALEQACERRVQVQGGRTSTLVVELEAHQSGEARLCLETRTVQARWKPTYEVRLSEDGRTLDLLCYAAVSQASGTPWNGVELEISNAQPSRSLGLPRFPEPVQVVYEAPGVQGTGMLQGTVTDTQGRAVPGVKLTLACAPLKLTRMVVTDAHGAYRFPLLPPGEFILSGESSGFPSLRTSVRMEVGRTQNLGLRLGNPGAAAGATVEVVAAAASLDRNETMTANSMSVGGLALISGGSGRQSAFNVDMVRKQLEDLPALEPAPSRFDYSGELGRAWVLEGPRTLPADAQPRRMLLARTTLEAHLGLRAAPRVSSDVFTIAQIQPPGGFPWFPSSPVMVFRGGAHLGQVGLPPLLSGEPVTLGFGPMAGMRVQRQRLEARLVGRSQGRQWSLKERITLVSDLGTEQEVEVMEPTLRALSDKVHVEALPDSTPPSRDTPQGHRVWRVKVPPKGQARVELGWKLQGPGTGFIPELPRLGLPHSD